LESGLPNSFLVECIYSILRSSHNCHHCYSQWDWQVGLHPKRIDCTTNCKVAISSRQFRCRCNASIDTRKDKMKRLPLSPCALTGMILVFHFSHPSPPLDLKGAFTVKQTKVAQMQFNIVPCLLWKTSSCIVFILFLFYFCCNCVYLLMIFFLHEFGIISLGYESHVM
jgi:hypothetical protein